MNVKRIKGDYDLDKLKKEIGEITKSCKWYTRNNSVVWHSIPLHTHNGEINVISNSLRPTQNLIFKPTTTLNKCPYIQSILKDLNTKIYLVRLLRLLSGGIIQEHIDINFNNPNYIRCHLPVVTHDDVEFYIDSVKYNLTAGSLWYTNVSLRHSVVNNSPIDRLHLVIDLELTDELRLLLNFKNS